ncbi:MAG TPA: hypothetical protein VFV11_08555 [Solimonas sp.]|nr:hypothetical protein [Solimonas sp.]
MTAFRPLLALLIAGSLSACATVTPYQPVKAGQGYSEQRIEQNRYRVSFVGNSLTPRETVENYLLFRAAELTLDAGYDYFVMTDNDTEARTRYTQSVSAYGGPYWGWGWGWGGRGGLGIGVSTASPSTDYQAQAFVLMYKGKKPEQDVRAYDARAVRDSLQPMVKRPEMAPPR